MTKEPFKTYKNIHMSAAYTLSRLSAEMAYVEKRLCLRKASGKVRQHLEDAISNLEKALQQAMKDEGME